MYIFETLAHFSYENLERVLWWHLGKKDWGRVVGERGAYKEITESAI